MSDAATNPATTAERRAGPADPPGADDTCSETLALSSFDLEAERPEPYSARVRVEFDALTHPGRVRPRNEDAFLVYRASRSWERLLSSLPEEDLPREFVEMAHAFCVADGMGGAAGGSVASSLALRTGVNLVLNAARWWMKLDNPQSRERAMRELIRRALHRFRQIDRALTAHADEHPTLLGMGTTLTVACSFGADLFVVHTGDSRAYLLRDGHLRQLTHDQTMTQMLQDAGQLTADRARVHQWRHMLTGVLGGRGPKQPPEAAFHRLRDGDRLILCTDGLTGMLDDDEIARIVAGAGSVQEGCRALVDAALDRGGRDNVTCVVARYELPPHEPPPAGAHAASAATADGSPPHVFTPADGG